MALNKHSSSILQKQLFSQHLSDIYMKITQELQSLLSDYISAFWTAPICCWCVKTVNLESYSLVLCCSLSSDKSDGGDMSSFKLKIRLFSNLWWTHYRTAFQPSQVDLKVKLKHVEKWYFPLYAVASVLISVVMTIWHDITQLMSSLILWKWQELHISSL